MKFDHAATVLLIEPDQIKNKKYHFHNAQLAKEIAALQKSGQFNGEDGELFPLVLNKKTVLLTGVGKGEENPLTALRMTVRKAFLSSFLSKIKDVAVVPHTTDNETLIAVMEGVLIGTYAWKKYKSKDPKDQSVDKKDVTLAAAKNEALEKTVLICEGVNLTRDLVNDNADTVTSEFIEKQLKQLIKGRKNISTEILNKKEMEAKGLGLHLAVNQGSPREPKLIIVKYQGGKRQDPTTAVIGKGITFDTGGLNLKPTGSMETMRTDMSGTAAVIGILKNAVAMGFKKNILFVCALAENVIGSRSYKPGDVFRGYSGKTVEIRNTDAEGRLVLADAIAYVVKNYKPARLIDLATLTGACVVALGQDYSGLMTNDVELSKQLIHSSNATDDRAWRLPVYPEIKEALKSPIADIKNTGFPKGAAGALTAAEFLRQFTDGIPWAHLDIAGTAYADSPGRLYYGPGATGAGVRLITNFLQNN